MKRVRPQQQTGAVLAFSLVMLLLLTLVGVNMIQQNKLQISMTGNSGQQTAAFSMTEQALSQATGQIVLNRNQGGIATSKKCNSGTQLNENSVLNIGISSAQAKVTQVYCMTNYSDITKTGVETRCPYINGVRDSTNDACKRLSSAGLGGGSAANLCNSELYTVNIVFTNSNTGATRTIESKFAVDCSADITAP